MSRVVEIPNNLAGSTLGLGLDHALLSLLLSSELDDRVFGIFIFVHVLNYFDKSLI